MTETEARRDQRLVTTRRGLRNRQARVNGTVPAGTPENPASAHLWACPGCGCQNDPRHLSCRVCETLKWGVAP